jgi:anti-anti-sigma regulatory factor
MSLQPSAEPRIMELVLTGDLVLQRIASLQEEILAALADVDRLLLNVSGASTFDLSFLQLLCSAHRSAVPLNKSLSLAGKLPESFQRKLEEAGFGRHVGCRFDCQNSCIWIP